MTKRRFTLHKVLFLVGIIILAGAFFVFFKSLGASLGKSTAPEKISIAPYYFTEEGEAAELSIIYYPADPQPGDFLLVEAGPFSGEEPNFLSFDFDGVKADSFEAAGLRYTLIAISCDSEPGSYELKLKSGRVEAPGEVLAETPLFLGEKEFSLSRFSMPLEVTQGWTAKRLEEEREMIYQARAISAPLPLWEGGFLTPAEGYVSSEFGAVRIINDNPPRRHQGIDLAASLGEPVFAAANGTVHLAALLLSGGNTVILDHGLGLFSAYMHLDTLAVEKGDRVAKGEILGTVGSTGYSTGPHLHFEVTINQEAVNPLQLFTDSLQLVPPAYVATFDQQ